MNLGKRIVKIRKDNKMSQEEFAEVLNVTRQTVSNWENSKNYPDIETLILISDKFNISLDILLKGDKKMIKDISKSIKNSKIYKRILIIIGIIALIFLIINLIWFVGVKSRYLDLTKNFNNSKNELNNYVKEIDGYRYIVKDTGYLGNSGFATVSIAEDIITELDDKGNEIPNSKKIVTLYIWPEWFEGYTYRIDIDDGNVWYQINVDYKGTYIPYENEDTDQLKAVLEDNREEINKLFDLADNMWDIR